jgi:hypothetical protein
MTSRIILLTVICIICFSLASAQDIEYVSSALHSGGITSITVSGDYAYCSIGRLLLILSVSDPTSPTLVKSSPGLGGDGALLRGDYIYFTRIYNSYPQVQLVDITEPENPVEVLRFGGAAEDIFIDSSYIYLASPNYGLQIYDNSNPLNPVAISSIHTIRITEGVDVVGHYAFIADFDSGLTVVDVADPFNPYLIGHYNGSSLGDHRFMDISVSGNYAYVADMNLGLRVFDISDPASPQYLSSANLYTHASSIIVDGNLAYLTREGDARVYIVDISDPAHPMVIISYRAIGDPARIFLADSILYVGGMTSSGQLDRNGLMHIVDVSDPENPTMLGEYVLPPRSSESVFVSGNYVYAGYIPFYMLDFSNPFQPTVMGYYERIVTAKDVWVRGDYAYVVASSLYVLSFADLANPVVAGSCPLYGEPKTITLKDNYAYIACDIAGLNILDISDPINPVSIGNFQNREDIHDADVAGSYAYLAAFFDGLTVINIEDPAHPESIGNWHDDSFLNRVSVSGNYAYAASGNRLIILDVSDPTSPELVAISDSTYGIDDIAVQGNLAYIAASYPNELAIIDITDPQSPHEIAKHELPSFARAIKVSGDMIYVGTGNSLITFRYPITSVEESPDVLPSDLLIVDNYPNPFNSSTIIEYDLPRPADVRLDIYDILGRKVETLVNTGQEAGHHSAMWNGKDYSSGVYFYRIQAGDYTETKRMTLLK